MTDPAYTCELCGARVVVIPTGRGYPPDVAKRKLAKACALRGCKCVPAYRAGVILGGSRGAT